MHKKIIEEATHEQLKCFAYEIFEMLKRSVDEDTYQEIELRLYEKVYGDHFNGWLLNKALDSMENEDGSKGGHWSLEQTSNLAKSNGITFVHFNEYDWNYVINMIYSDYYKTIGTNTSAYVDFARAFLMDKDAPKGKALKYYLAMKN